MQKQTEFKGGVEILCIGTELLLGDILNSNAQWLAKQLALLGLPHYQQSVVGDNEFRLKEKILESKERCHVLITTGGIGPTPDDLTTATIASAFNTPLEENEEAWIDIQQKISSKSKKSALSNRKQALFPVGAKLIPNPSGTAPGMIWQPSDGFTILTFPGVPSELKLMWNQTAIQWFKTQGMTKNIFLSRVLKVSGIPESTLAEDISELLKKTNPTVATYAKLGEVELRLTAKASTIGKAKELISPIEKQLRDNLGPQCYGSDNESLASVLIALLRKRKESLSIAESCTGGGLGAAITAIPGASDIFKGGIISYSNSIKQEILRVPETLIKQYGAVSREVVQAMAIGVREKLKSDWAIAISGVAGPEGGTNASPVGCVHIAIAGPQGCESKLIHFGSYRERKAIQQLSVLSGLDQLRLILQAQS